MEAMPALLIKWSSPSVQPANLGNIALTPFSSATSVRNACSPRGSSRPARGCNPPPYGRAGDSARPGACRCRSAFGDERDRRVHTPAERGGSTGLQPPECIVGQSADRAIRAVLLGHGARVCEADVRAELLLDRLLDCHDQRHQRHGVEEAIAAEERSRNRDAQAPSGPGCP